MNGQQPDLTYFTAIIAVAGTLLGVVLTAILSHIFQGKTAERQRKWAREDAEQLQVRELKKEQDKLKRDLLNKRLEPIEEAMKLLGVILSSAEAKELGLPMPDDGATIQQTELRLQEIRATAWSAIMISGSEELKKHWSTLSGAYWDLHEVGSISGFEGIGNARIEIMKILDGMRIKSCEY